jgi:hypothetical protein
MDLFSAGRRGGFLRAFGFENGKQFTGSLLLGFLQLVLLKSYFAEGLLHGLGFGILAIMLVFDATRFELDNFGHD